METSPRAAPPAFDYEGPDDPGILLALRSDVEINLGRGRTAAGLLGALTMLVRLFTNPQIRACLLIRLAASPRWGTGWVWRNLLITLHSTDVRPGAEIAPGLCIPHPYGLVIPSTARIGPGVWLGHNVTLIPRTPDGEESEEPIVLEANVKVFTNSSLTAGVTVGEGAVVGSHALVTEDVEPGATVRAHSRH